MLDHQFVPRSLPSDFPRAIRWTLSTDYPSEDQELIDLSMDTVYLSLASQELVQITGILRQRRDLIVREASRREVVRRRIPGVSGTQAGRLFVANIMRTRHRVAVSDVEVLPLEVDLDHDVPDVSSLDLLD
jgi:hypothetical protein